MSRCAALSPEQQTGPICALALGRWLASEFMSNDILKDLEKLVDGVKTTLETAKAREAAFNEWYGKLMTAMPALSRESVTLTSDNFRKAMRQAYRAGNSNG